MTQKARADNIVSKLVIPDLDELNSILAEAQNRPPRGLADGSLYEDAWTLLRDICSTADELRDLVETYHEEHADG